MLTEHLDTMHRAEQHMQNGEFAAAERLYQNMLIKHPENHRAALGAALAMLSQHKLAESILFMQRAADIAPDVMLYKRNLGELLRRARQFGAAIATLQSVIRLEPDSAENHYLLGLAYNDNRQFDLAVKHYHTTIAIQPHYGAAWNNLGATHESMGDKQNAKIAYTTAVALNPNHTEAQNNLGAIFSEEGKLEDARTHFAAAIAAHPAFVDAHYNLSLLKKYTLDDTHLTYLEDIKKNIDTLSVHNRIRCHFALGKALDDTQQYERAFKEYAAGNQLQFQQQPWHENNLQQIVSQIPAVFTSSFLTRRQRTQEKRCPIFIVGMPRAGTTLIEQILASHQQVYGAGELSILDDVIQQARHASNLPFCDWAAQLSDADFAMLGAQYLERTWQLAPDKNFIIDKMPANSFYIGMIYRMLPQAKIIHAIRDPMDSCFSCYTHLFKEGMFFSYDLTALGNYYKLYADTMRHWNHTLPQDTIFHLPYEKMVAEQESMSKQLVDYIGLPWDENCLQFYNNNRLVKTASLTQVRKPIYQTSVQRWRHYASELAPLLQMVAPYRNVTGISA